MMQQILLGYGGSSGGGGDFGTSSHRYWRVTTGATGGSNPYDDHAPRAASYGLNTSNSTSGVTDIVTYTSSNCSDSGTIVGGNSVIATYDHGSPISFTHFFVDSVFSGGIRSISYKVERSDDNSTWTEAWRGVVHNQTSGSWPADGTSPGGVSSCGTLLAAGERFMTSTSPNDGTVFSNNFSGGSFDQPVSNAFNGYLQTSPRARTGGNAVTITFTCNITVTSFVQVFAEDGYNSTCVVTIDGTTYTSSSGSSHRFEQPGTMTQMTLVNNSGSGRTYLEGIVVDGYLLKDNANGETGWDMS